MINETITTIPAGYVPSYFLYIITSILFLSFLVFTSLYKSKKTDWGNFWWVVLFSAIVTGITLTFFVLAPEQFNNWITKLSAFFGF